jgi:crotonobetainyl-CoA:carnitine CoA-transferase CaiB-like acyl-CoA transferase
MVRVSNSGELPLEGTTVVDLTQVVAGPFATMTLADLGAEVIKIEAVGRGDRARRIRPIPEYYDAVNRNKRSIAANLKTEEGQQVVRDLVADADVFIESMKPGRPGGFNLAYENLVEINPNLIYCSISGFGEGSPYENVPAWDMVIQAMSGIMSITGKEDGPPVWSGLPSGDLIASMYAVQSVIAALYARERGQIDTEWIEVPMLDATISWLTVRAGYTFGFDDPFPRNGTHHPSIAPFGVYECRDTDIVIAAGTQSLWEDLCDALNCETLLEQDRFATMEDRVENVDALRDFLHDELADRSADEVVSNLHAADVPAGPIHDTETIWEDEHVKQRDLHCVMERENREDADVITHPIHFANLATTLGEPPEALAQSTDSLLKQQGYTEEQITDLRERGIIG